MKDFLGFCWLGALLFLAGCDRGDEGCFRVPVEEGGPSLPTEARCFDDQPSERIDGYLNYQFEAVSFHSEMPLHDDIYSDLDEMTWVYIPDDASDQLGGEAIYKVSFVGKRAREAGLYGHMGMFGSAVSVERFETVERIRDVYPWY
ncbi:hypothetical protein [Sphingomicrobium arenosum]|uniref:hypothetical protein n=1 Tax=Sphingomicrobium arenosum TaxID=2233861 RepID=UPI00223EC9B3|nr:hypothetical protein [Sphingomicrobium arenosum]